MTLLQKQPLSFQPFKLFVKSLLPRFFFFLTPWTLFFLISPVQETLLGNDKWLFATLQGFLQPGLESQQYLCLINNLFKFVI